MGYVAGPIADKIRGIKTVREANEFLLEYIEIFNNRFALKDDFESDFVPLPPSVDFTILSVVTEQRRILKGGIISLKNVKFSVGLDKIGAKIDVLISKRLGVVAKYEEKIYELKPIEWQKNSINSSDSVEMILARFSL